MIAMTSPTTFFSTIGTDVSCQTAAWRRRRATAAGFVSMLATALLFVAVGPVSAQTPGSAVAAASCYGQDDAVAGGVGDGSRSAADDEWLGSDIVQMSLRRISLLADADTSIHGYQIHSADRVVAVVHARSATPAEVVEEVERALARAAADVNSTDVPRVVVYPACRQLANASDFDALEESIETVQWTDEPAYDLIGIAVDRDLAATQVVVSMEQSNAVSDRLSEQLLAAYGDDVRVVINPDHPKFLPTLSLATGDDEAADAASAATATTVTTSRTAVTGESVTDGDTGGDDPAAQESEVGQSWPDAAASPVEVASGDSPGRAGSVLLPVAIGSAALLAAGSVVFAQWRRSARGRPAQRQPPIGPDRDRQDELVGR